MKQPDDEAAEEHDEQDEDDEHREAARESLTLGRVDMCGRLAGVAGDETAALEDSVTAIANSLDVRGDLLVEGRALEQHAAQQDLAVG